MTADRPEPDDVSLRPPEPSTAGVLRWATMGVALLVLVLGAYQAYEWLAGTIAQRRALAEGTATAPAAAPTAAASQPPQPVQPAPRADTGEPLAPAVTGVAIRRCVRDGQITFTNQPCPSGSSVADAPTGGVPAPDEPLFDADRDPSQHTAACHYLQAEIERLSYEFGQPLPPPVLDRISTDLARLRGESAQGRCATAPPALRGAGAPSHSKAGEADKKAAEPGAAKRQAARH